MPLSPSVPPNILVASMMRTSISGMMRVTMEKYIPRSLSTGSRDTVQIMPPNRVAWETNPKVRGIPSKISVPISAGMLHHGAS